MSNDKLVKKDDGDEPVGDLTAGVMVIDYLNGEHPEGHAFVTEKDGAVEVHGTKHAVNERIVGRLASGKFSVRANNLATPKRKQVASWLERQQMNALCSDAPGSLEYYQLLKRFGANEKRAARRRELKAAK